LGTPKLSKQLTTPRENCTPRALFNSKLQKRGRNEDGVAIENARVTRSKTQAEEIALFLRSPAARIRPNGMKEDCLYGVSDVLLKKYDELVNSSKSKV